MGKATPKQGGHVCSVGIERFSHTQGRPQRPHDKADLNLPDQLDFGVRALWQVSEGLRACPTNSYTESHIPGFLEKWLLYTSSHFQPERAGQRKRMVQSAETSTKLRDNSPTLSFSMPATAYNSFPLESSRRAPEQEQLILCYR